MKLTKILGIGALVLGLCGCKTFGRLPQDYQKDHDLKYKKLSESGEFEVSGRLYNNSFRNLKYTLSNLDKDPKLDLEFWSDSREYYIGLHIGDGEGSDNLIDGNVNYVCGDLSIYEGYIQGHFKTYIKYDDEGNVTEIYNYIEDQHKEIVEEGNFVLKKWQDIIEKEFGDKVKIPEGVK